MIEAASRSLRQQMGRTRDRPRSKGSLHDTRSQWDAERAETPSGVSETAQRRTHSTENQHRLVHTRGGPGAGHNSSSASALDHYPPQDEVVPESTEDGTHSLEVPPFHDLKRPLSRKKGPSASAAAGLGAFSGPLRNTDAFEQRKTRQPIPVESWGQRPPSRHGLPQRGAVATLDTGLDEDPKLISPSNRRTGDGGPAVSAGRPSSRAGSDQPCQATESTWAAARGVPPRSLGEVGGARKGRDRRPPQRSAPEDLGVFGRGTTQQMQKSLSGVGVGPGVYDHSSPFKDGDGLGGARQLGGAWSSLSADAPDGPEDVTGPWPITPSSQCNSPPQRRGRHSLAEAGTPVSLEDVEADPDSSFWNDRSTTPQVIVTRSSQAARGRGDPRRRGDREQAPSPAGMPFKTTLDVDFLSLFAS